jgi:uroporphyrinogen decarboxylase
MTPRDVVVTALKGNPPPYVPWSFRFTKEPWSMLCKHYGIDHKDLPAAVGNHIVELGSDIGFFEDVGQEKYRDVFGVVWDRSVDRDIGIVCDYPLKEPTLKGYTFPNPLDDRFFEEIEDKKSRQPNCFSLFCLGFSLFERAWTMRGMENLMMDFFDEPEFVHDLFRAIADYNLAQVEKALTYDIDAVYFGDDWGQQSGLIMGYPRWKEYIAPQLKRMYGMVKASGKFQFIHSCGDVDELFPDLIELGLDCFNPFQPEVMDTLSLMKEYRGRLSFWGGLSTQRTLPNGSVDDVIRETNRLIEEGRHGNYILSPSHAVESDVPLENILAFVNAAQGQDGYTKS